MAHIDEVVESPRTRIIFRKTAQDTAGEVLQFEQFVQPNAPATVYHIHPKQAEFFRVVSGKMGVRVNGQTQILEAGAEVTVPPNTPHAMWNAGEDTLHQVIELRPALRSETFFETIVGLERDGKLPEKGVPNILQMSLVLLAYNNPLAQLPHILQTPLFAVLAAIGWLLGYRSWYRRYSPYGPVTGEK